MELAFQKQGNLWVAEFEVPGDFNLHLERVSKGSIAVSQRSTVSGGYDTAFYRAKQQCDKIFDYDFGALVYPKHIKVASSSEVIKAEVNLA